MTENELEKLIKLLNLTNSDNDHEAINAMRAANTLLAKSGSNWSNVFKKVQKEQKSYRWKEMPQFFDSGFFRSAMECKEFMGYLSKDQIEALNTYIRFFNKHYYIPQKHWTKLVELWHNFREVSR